MFCSAIVLIVLQQHSYHISCNIRFDFSFIEAIWRQYSNLIVYFNHSHLSVKSVRSFTTHNLIMLYRCAQQSHRFVILDIMIVKHRMLVLIIIDLLHRKTLWSKLYNLFCFSVGKYVCKLLALLEITKWLVCT